MPNKSAMSSQVGTILQNQFGLLSLVLTLASWADKVVHLAVSRTDTYETELSPVFDDGKKACCFALFSCIHHCLYQFLCCSGQRKTSCFLSGPCMHTDAFLYGIVDFSVPEGMQWIET
jgi:hypothetical protein